ncbi:hypothetical protein [Dictyobacter aurantiacus]|uniref:Uncharacterized protein n=1 Tax=Dictyobacter aurantiacus TaxID=1936993 RepID=A0A401ZJY7_9CHLR|nr:hypothetical protein [Dictyobacter aurantiacus]GCE07175.1 hypothetical protein KDAU_45040 [Dictyobacter aurantiacus]
MHSPLLRCPRCGQVDAVQKVSAISAGNQAYELYTRGGRVSHGNERKPFATGRNPYQTPLSERLAFPERRHGCSLVLLITFAAILTPASAILAWMNYGTAVSDPSSAHQTALLLTLALTLVCVAIALICSLMRTRQRRLDKPRRERALTLWNTLYYCHRDDTVFVADNPLQIANSRTMHTLIGY